MANNYTLFSFAVAGWPKAAIDHALALAAAVDALGMDGRAPFPELVEFKARCFRSFPASLVQRTNLSQVLRLYACAYQRPQLWKELWKGQLCLMSPQIIKDCEGFAQEVPFAAEAFMLHLLSASL